MWSPRARALVACTYPVAISSRSSLLSWDYAYRYHAGENLRRLHQLHRPCHEVSHRGRQYPPQLHRWMGNRADAFGDRRLDPPHRHAHAQRDRGEHRPDRQELCRQQPHVRQLQQLPQVPAAAGQLAHPGVLTWPADGNDTAPKAYRWRPTWLKH